MPNLQTNKQERIISMKNRLLPQEDQVSAQLKDIYPNNIYQEQEYHLIEAQQEQLQSAPSELDSSKQ